MSNRDRERPDPSRSMGRPGIFEGSGPASVPPKKRTCPKCGETERLSGRGTQWEFINVCLKCGFEWSAGSMNVAQADFSDPLPMPGVPAPADEEDLNMVQYTGAAFRDPSKNH